MKYIIALMLVLGMAFAALADQAFDSTHKSVTLFSGQSATGTSAIASSAQHLFRTTRASAAFSCMSSSVATTYINGTATLQTGPTSSGPWSTLRDKAGNAVTLAAGNAFSTYDLDTVAYWVRAVWTPAAISTNRSISVYLLGLD